MICRLRELTERSLSPLTNWLYCQALTRSVELSPAAGTAQYHSAGRRSIVRYCRTGIQVGDGPKELQWRSNTTLTRGTNWTPSDNSTVAIIPLITTDVRASSCLQPLQMTRGAFADISAFRNCNSGASDRHSVGRHRHMAPTTSTAAWAQRHDNPACDAITDVAVTCIFPRDLNQGKGWHPAVAYEQIPDRTLTPEGRCRHPRSGGAELHPSGRPGRTDPLNVTVALRRRSFIAIAAD